jgi:hypothetical protein
MKIKAGELKIIGEGLEEILTKEIPIKPAYWLARFLNKLQIEFGIFEKARMHLVDKHVKLDEDNKPLFKKDKEGKDTNRYDIADMNAFQKEFDQLVEEEIEINFKPIKLADLGDIKIKPIILAKLGKVIEE